MIGACSEVVDTLGNIDGEPAPYGRGNGSTTASQDNGISDAIPGKSITNDNANFSARVLLLRAQLSSGDTNAVVSAQSLNDRYFRLMTMKMVLATTLAVRPMILTAR
jgi:hypothetical protein